MSNLFRRVELLANVAIIIVAILLGGVIVKRFILNRDGHSHPAAKELAPGDKVPLAEADWAKNGRTILIVLQKGCRFCTESAPFYQRLVRELSGRSDVRLVALLPQQVADGKQYLNEMGVSIDDVRQVSLAQLNVRGTPTLILVNRDGVATDVWPGKLPSDEESKVLDSLK
jgi:thioredoxin-related protein